MSKEKQILQCCASGFSQRRTADTEYSGRFYTACPVMETVDSGMMETAIPEMQNQ